MDVSDVIMFYPAKPFLFGNTPVTDGPYPASDTVMVTTVTVRPPAVAQAAYSTPKGDARLVDGRLSRHLAVGPMRGTDAESVQ